MKKVITGTIMVAGLLLFASCGSKEGIGPLPTPEVRYTPTPIVVPTCTPTATPTPDPAFLPEPTTEPVVTETPVSEPTKAPTPSPEPTEAPTPSPEPTEAPTPSPEPTKAPTPSPEPTKAPTPSPEPTKAPTPSPEPTKAPTPSLEPTKAPTPSPEPTKAPTPSPEPTKAPTPSPEPTKAPEPTEIPTNNPAELVNYGWQKTVSIDDKYNIIFPACFRTSTVSKMGNELRVEYGCPEDDTIEFLISYHMQQILKEAAGELLIANGEIAGGSIEEKKVECRWQTEERIYYGILTEEMYPDTLLGNAFGEAKEIAGVMQVVFSYPIDRQEEYTTSEYRFYVMESGED